MSFLRCLQSFASLVFLLPLNLNAALLAHIETNFGTITAELDYENSPRTVANFVRLAEGLAWAVDPDDGIAKRRPFFNGTTFHRVVKNFVLQGGCPIGDGTGGPGWTFPDETDNGLNHQLYSLSMANTGPNSNGSQFFIISRTISPASVASLNGKHTVFGRVNLPASRAIVDTIENTPVEANATGEISRPISPVAITSVSIEATDNDARAFNSSAQDLPSIDLSIDRVTQLRESADGQFEILTPQAVGSELRVFRSTDLETWNLEFLRYIPADDAAESKFSFTKPTDDQGFYRVTHTDYPASASSPSVLSGKRITAVALSPTSASLLSFYDFFLNEQGTGTWQARNGSNQRIAQGSIDSSSHRATPYGGTLIISSSNLPYSSRYRIAYGLRPDDDPQGSWSGEHQLTYIGVGSLQTRQDFEIITLSQP